MKKEADKAGADELREEYDFSRGVRGKYAQRYSEGTNIIILDADVAKVFRDSESVNKALRALVEVANREQLVADYRWRAAVGKKRACRQNGTNSLVAPLSDGSPRASRYPCPQFTSDDLAPVHCHGIGFALTGQVTPIHSPALVDLVGRVPGAPPDQPTGSQPSTSSRGLGATCHPWRQGWGHGWRSPCIRRDPRVAGRPRTHGAHGAHGAALYGAVGRC